MNIKDYLKVKDYISFKSRKNSPFNFISFIFLCLFILLLIITAIIDTFENKGSSFFQNLFTLNGFELLVSLILFLVLYGIGLTTIILLKNTIIKNEKKSLESLIKAIIIFVESKDDYTAEHHRKVAKLSTAIAGKMGLSEERIKLIHRTSLVHDIGKINISTEILNKKTKLDDSELAQIKSHSIDGYKMIEGIHNFDQMAKIILQHHERNDGSGYPYGLISEEIMIEAKIIAVADVFEAMASKRPYGGAFQMKKILETLSKNRGKLFDSEAVESCIELFTIEKFKLD